MFKTTVGFEDVRVVLVEDVLPELIIGSGEDQIAARIEWGELLDFTRLADAAIRDRSCEDDCDATGVMREVETELDDGDTLFLRYAGTGDEVTLRIARRNEARHQVVTVPVAKLRRMFSVVDSFLETMNDWPRKRRRRR